MKLRMTWAEPSLFSSNPNLRREPSTRLGPMMLQWLALLVPVAQGGKPIG